MVKYFTFFMDYLATVKLFGQTFAITISDVHVKAGNHDSSLGNESEDVKQQNLFTAKEDTI